jgi:hypothetical protein
MTASYTRSNVQTNTLSKVIYVTRKVQADLLTILDHYSYFSEDYIQDLIHDIRIFIDEEVISRFKFVWTKPDSSFVLEELDYFVIFNRVALADDRSGNIVFRLALVKANFRVQITYNERWQKMSEVEKKSIRDTLKLTWGTAIQLTYEGGHWSSSSERTYSQDGLGLKRSRYTTP